MLLLMATTTVQHPFRQRAWFCEYCRRRRRPRPKQTVSLRSGISTKTDAACLHAHSRWRVVEIFER